MNKQGTNLILEASADAPIQNLQLYGKSEQFTTTGAQLIPFELGAEMTSEDGVAKCVPQKDGFRIELNGTSTQSAKSDIRFVGGYNYLEEDSYDEYENLPAGTYYAKISDDRFTLNVIAWRGTNITLISTSTGGSFEVQDGDKFRIFIRPSVSAVDATVKAIISKQDDSVMYEPYTGGKPSPSTDYSQEIVNAGDDGDIQVDVTGANMNNGEMSRLAGSAGGTIVDHGIKRAIIVPITGGKTYVLSYQNGDKEITFHCTTTDYPSVGVEIVDVYTGSSGNAVAEKIMTTSDTARYLVVNIGSFNGEALKNAMLNEGSTALPYEPYKQPQSLTVQTPNGLPGIPVTSGGNYTDSTGQQWVCDEVDFRRGKYVQRVKKEYLTGTPNFQKSSGSVKHKWSNALTNSYKSENSAVLSTFGIYSAWANPIEGNEVICIDGHNLYWSTPTEMTAEEANTKFSKMIASDNPPYVIGQLETPIETDLTPEQMQQFLALRSYYPTTVVTNDEDVWMRVQYLSNDDLPDGPYSEPRSEIGQYYRALSGHTREYPESTCRETALIKCILDGTLEPPFTEPSCATEAYLLDLINNTTTMVEWTPRNDTEKFLAMMIGVTVNDYPSTDCERSFWMARCAEVQLMREAIRNGGI